MSELGRPGGTAWCGIKDSDKGEGVFIEERTRQRTGGLAVHPIKLGNLEVL